MEEKLLKGKKNGLAVLVIDLIVMIAAIVLMIYGFSNGIGSDDAITNQTYFIMGIISTIAVCFLWIPLLGLKILRPQEAYVLTLFGKYYGTLKGEGFYWVNPFCTAINPASGTKLNQSGDVNNLSASLTGKKTVKTSILNLTSISAYRSKS